MKFDSHVVRVLTAAVELVNTLTPGDSRGTPYAAPAGAELVRLTGEALGGRPITADQARHLAVIAARMRIVFEADLDEAAHEVNRLLHDTEVRPRLDHTEQGWNLHFHGAEDTVATGWAAGCAAGLALALGSDLAGRLGVCAAPVCDRVYVDVSRNAQRRFCSPRCQSRVKAAANRARRTE